MILINAGIVIILSLILSDIFYILYKKKKGVPPSGKILFMVISPILGATLSVAMRDESVFIMLKNMLLFTIIIDLIPVNLICLKNGFKRSVTSAKNTFIEGKKLIEEEKKENETIKENYKNKKDSD